MRRSDLLLNGLKQIFREVAEYHFNLISLIVLDQVYDGRIRLKVRLKFARIDETWIVECEFVDNITMVMVENKHTTKGETPF